jgi:TM2 domain-containing membrane protein YozV
LENMTDVEDQPMTTPPPLPDPESGLPPLPPAGLAPALRPPKNPPFALFLSLFPGLGQVYNGQVAKAFTFLFAFVASIYATAEISALPFAFLIPFTYFFNLIDAFRSASQINLRAQGGRLEPEADSSESPVWGAVLLGLGLLLLLNNVGWINLAVLERFWPVLLIVAGGVFLYRSMQRKKAATEESFRDRLR